MHKETMTSRKRVLTALNHQEPDRCPMQISFTPEFAARLRAALDLEGDAHNPHGGGNTYALELALDEDMLLTSVGWANSYYSGDGADTYTDEWGITWRNVAYETRFGTGHYTEMIGHPLADDQASAEALVRAALRLRDERRLAFYEMRGAPAFGGPADDDAAAVGLGFQRQHHFL